MKTQKLLVVLAAISAVLAVALGVLASLDPALMPPKCAGYAAAFAALLKGAQMIIRKVGDLLDDGEANDSFNPDRPNVVRDKVPLLLTGGMALMLCACDTLTPRQQAFVDGMVRVSVPLAQIGLRALAANGSIREGDSILIGNGIGIIANATGTREKVQRLSELGLEAAVKRGVLNPGDIVTIQEAAAVIEREVPPAGKQPLVLPVK